MADKRVDALTIVIDADNGRVKASLAELEAYLKAIRDETVNIDIDVNARDINALRKSFKAAEGDIIALERYLKKNEATLDRRSKLFKSLNPLTRDFINSQWDALKATEANADGVQDLSEALKDVRNAYQSTNSVAQDLNERQRIAAKGNEKAAKLAREEAKARDALIKEIEKEDAAYRKSIATQERAFQQNEQYDLNLAKLADRHAQLSNEIAKVSGRSAFLKTPQDIAKLQRLQAELAHTTEAFRRMGGDMTMLDNHSERSQNTLSRLVDQISRVRLHLGFFSLNVKQAAYALTAFGPVISGLIGAFSSLIGVLGTGLVGALGLAGAAMGGFALNAAGIGFALKPLINEFTIATDAASKYYDQVIKTGRGSEEAQDKLADYKTTLKNLPPETRAAVVEFGRMRASWMKVTEELRKPFFDLMADGMQTLNSLMPMFQRNTVKAFGAASQGVRQWLSGLRGPEAQKIMGTLMTSVTAATPALMKGIGNVVTALARLSQASARALPDIMRNFSEWSQGLADRTDANGFAQRVNTIMDSLRAVGRVVTSASRLVVTFFSTGAASGESFANSITKTFNRWNSWMKSVAGQQSLKKFFEESVQEMSNLYDIISPIVKIFARFVQTMRPVSVAFQRIAAAGLEVLNIIMQIPGAAQLVAAALTGKMVLGIIGSLRALTFAFGALRTRMLGASAASVAVGTSMAQLKVAMTGVAASTLPGVGKQATVVATGMSRLALAGRGIVGLFGGPIGIALTAATVGLMFFGDEISDAMQGSRSFEEILIDQQKALRDNELASAAAANSVKRYNSQLQEAEASAKAYNKAVEEGASGEQLDKLFDRTATSAEAADKSIKAIAENVSRYRQTNATLRQTNIEAAQSFLDMSAASKGVFQKFFDDIGLGGKPIASLGDYIGKEFRAQILAGGVSVAEFTRRIKAMPGLEDFELSPAGRKALHDLRMFKISEDLRNLNELRLVGGLQRLPAQIAGPLNELGRALPTAAFERFKGLLLSIASPRAATNVTLLARELQKIKGPRGFPIGATLAERILGKGDPNKPEQTVKRLGAAIQRLTGKKPKLEVDVQKDKLAAAQAQIRRIQQQIKQGFRGRMQIDNLVATMTKARDLYARVKDIDALQPSVTVEIEPKFTGTWTKQVTLTPKDNTGGWQGGKFAQGGDLRSNEDFSRTARKERSTTQGGRYASPTFLVGEERRPEFVIATNPAYRRNNIQYWMDAGMALGVPGFAAGNAPIIGGGNAKPARPKAPGAIGNYEWYKKLISWSETETTNTRAQMDAQLARGAITQLDYTALLSDVTRTEGYYYQLNNTIFELMKRARQKANKGQKNSKAKRKPKKEDYSKTDAGQDQFDKDLRVWEKNQQKEKDNKQKLRDYYQERLDIGQALDALAIQKMELENERDTGGPLGVSPMVGEAVNLLAGGYALQQQFGSNTFGGAASIGGGGSFVAPGGTLPPAPPTNPMVGEGNGGLPGKSGGPGGKVVNITNNYQEQPADPHTWSKNLAWEVGVA